ncbi:hypothetical protein [Trinickia diaoshuihuensis]|uniref:hypothetical protein n=1 Tax=Trinickia diaoshuihuensis TaxID=2292265 RepID=UPI000E21C68B|nr:hypothetical protein [Trinickia diaoshuihuensis]
MIEQAKKQILRRKLKDLAFQALAALPSLLASASPVGTVYAAPAAEPHAPLARPVASNARARGKDADFVDTVTFENTSAYTLTISSGQSSCIRSAQPGSVVVKPRSSQVVTLTESGADDGQTECGGRSKQLTWNASVDWGGSKPGQYAIQFSDRVSYGIGQIMITSPVSNLPGTPSAATCVNASNEHKPADQNCFFQTVAQFGRTAITITFQ